MSLQIVVNIIVEELDCDFEDLVLVDAHHHQQVPESKVTYLHKLFIAKHCLAKPTVLVAEEFRVEVGDASGQYLEDVSVPLPDRCQHHMDLVVVVGERNQFVKLIRYAPQHGQILMLLNLILFLWF